MKKKFKINFAYDAPVTLTFAFISIAFYLVNQLICKGALDKLFLASPTGSSGALAFNRADFLSYIRLVFYVFGSRDFSQLMANVIFILLLGPEIEERYGSVIIGIMLAVTTVFSGVLNACFCLESLKGSSAIVLMMIFLNSFITFSKKKIPLSVVAVFAFFILREFFDKNPNGAVGIIINLAGGLCGSLFAFLASPKAKASRKSATASSVTGKGLKNRAEQIAEIDAASPRFKNKSSSYGSSDSDDSDDTTVIGTLKF